MLTDVIFAEEPNEEEIAAAVAKYLQTYSGYKYHKFIPFFLILFARLFRPKYYDFYYQLQYKIECPHVSHIEWGSGHYLAEAASFLSEFHYIIPNREMFLNDDIDALKRKIAEIPDYNFHISVIPAEDAFKNFLNIPEDFYQDTKMNNLCVAAYFGAVNIFKYIYNNTKLENIPNDLHRYAIIGGNHDIIHIVADEIGQSFDSNDLEYTIRAHHYELSDWIILNYDVKLPPSNIVYLTYNFKAYWYIISNERANSKN